MPAKKKASKSAAVLAKEQQLAHEAELLRMEQEKERLRNEERELRQRIEEEEGRALEAHRVREAEISCAIAEKERKAYYVAREQELLSQVAQKEQELQESKAKYSLLEQSNQMMETEKASAARRIAMLNNELELAQVKLLEAEERITDQDEANISAQRQLEAELDTLQQNYAEVSARGKILDQSRKELQEKIEKLEEAAVSAPPEPTLPASMRLSSTGEQNPDVETAALLNLLRSEVEKYKMTATNLRTDLDRQEREGEKTNLLVGVLNTQLEAVREDNKHLHEMILKRQGEMDATYRLLEEVKGQKQELIEEMERTMSAAAVQQRQLQLELDVHRDQASKLTEELTNSKKQYAVLTEEHKDLATRSTAREQTDYEANVSMKLELEKLRFDLKQALSAKETAEEERHNHKLLTRSEIDSLKSRLQKMEETMERKDREAFETIAVLRADQVKLENVNSQQAKEHQFEEEQLKNSLSTACNERDAVQAKLDELHASSTKREKELYEQLTSVTARQTVGSEEVERLRTDLQKREAEYTNNSIFLNAECENLKTQLNDLKETSEEHRRKHLQQVERLQGELSVLGDRMEHEKAAAQNVLTREIERADMAERNVRRLQDRILEMEDTGRLNELKHGDAVKCLQTENRELRSELGIGKRTIQRLETAIGDQAGYRQLTELNDKLTKEVDSYRSTVKELTNTVTALRSEENVMNGFKVHKLQGEKETLTRRLKQIEHRYLIMAPLFAKMRVVVAEAHPPTPLVLELRDALEFYDAQAQLATSIIVTSVTNATATDCTATLPKMIQPRPPSSEVALGKKSFMRSAAAARSANPSPYADGSLPPLRTT